MKKALIIFVVIGVVLIVAGSITAVIALASVNFDFEKIGSGKKVEETYEIEGDFSAIELSGCRDLRFVITEDGAAKAVYSGSDRSERSVTVKNGVLTVSENDKFRFGFDFIKCNWTVYLTKNAYDLLRVKNSTGDVTVPAGLSFVDAYCVSSTGDFIIDGTIIRTAQFSTSTGDVRLSGFSPESLNVVTSTGDVRIEGLTVASDVGITVSTGKVFLSDLECASLTVKSTTGTLRLTNVTSKGQMKLTTSTGDVRFDRSDAETINVHTSTGDVTGTLRSGKSFEYKTSTGDVRLPSGTTGGLCRIETSTGDIDLSIAS